jgi:hypothetical protein
MLLVLRSMGQQVLKIQSCLNLLWCFFSHLANAFLMYILNWNWNDNKNMNVYLINFILATLMDIKFLVFLFMFSFLVVHTLLVVSLSY